MRHRRSNRLRVRLVSGFWLALGLSWLVLTTPVQADTLQVAIDDPGCDDVVGLPFCEIGAAIAAAQDGDTLEIAAGDYAGDLLINKDLLLQGADTATTRIVGGSVAVARIFSDVILQRLTLTGSPGRGLISSGDSVRLFQCVVEDNGPAPGGAGILLTQGNLVLEESVVRNNQSEGAGGGGVWMQEGSLFVTESSILGNATLDAASPGGGVLISQGSAVFATSSVAGNTSANNGGGIVASSPGSLVLDACDVVGNEAAGTGGGLHVAATVTVRNSTLSGNRANTHAAIGRFTGTAPIVLENVTVFGNQATTHGAGVSLGAESEVSNSILAGNLVAGVVPNDCSGSLGSLGYNLIQAVGCTVSGDTATNLTGVDPKLGPLALNGGRTPSHRPAIDSPVVDAGNPTAGGCPAVDQRAEGRPVDGNDDGVARCDIGSVERFQPLFYDGFEDGNTDRWDATDF